MAQASRPPAGRSLDYGHLHARVTRRGETATFALSGELDMTSVEPLEDQIVRLENAGIQTLILDLSRLSFIDSMGLRLILRMLDRSARLGHRLALVRGPSHVQRLFENAGVLELLEFVDDPEDA